MRLLSLEVEHFRAIRSGRLQFGRGLNVIYGPNDHGKSTLTEAIRAALLVTPGSAESRSFATWGAPPGQLPRVVLVFECRGATWQVEKVFGFGSKAKARLEKSTDGGIRYHTHAQARDVEGKLRDLLNWGLAPPGGRGAVQRTETYLTTALLGKQGEVSAIFDASLKRDQDDTGRALVTRALDALGQDPVVTRLLERLKERSGAAYTASGRHKRSADSPLVRARMELKEREDRLRSLEESARKGQEVEEQARRLLHEREQALEERDQARARLDGLREQAAAAARREELEKSVSRRFQEHDRVAAAFDALAAAREEHTRAEAALAAIGAEWQGAIAAAQAGETAAQAARERLARAQAADAASAELSAAERGAQVADLRARLEKAGARKTAALAAVAARKELESIESKLAAARQAFATAKEEADRAAAELNLALALEELADANARSQAVAEAVSEHEKHAARESAVAAAIVEANAALKAAAENLDTARNAGEQARRADETRAMNLRVLDTRILHAEAAVRDERQAVERARSASQRIRRAEEAQAAAVAAEAIAAEIDARLTANAAEIAQAEVRLRNLEVTSWELGRRSAAAKVDELSVQESAAREHRRRAAEARDRAVRLDGEAGAVRLPAASHLASLWAAHGELKSRKAAGPTAVQPPIGIALVAGVAAGAVAFAIARYGASAGNGASIAIALSLGIALTAITALAAGRRAKAQAEASWRAEIERLESSLAGDMAPVLAAAGVRTLEEIDSKRRQIETIYTEAERLRQEAASLDREADSMFERTAGLSSFRRELDALTGNLASHRDRSPLESEIQAGLDALQQNTLREQERLDRAHALRDQLQTERVRQVAICASKRATAETALAERGDTLPEQAETAIAEAECRWRKAEAELGALREERRQAAEASLAEPKSVSQSDVREAEQAAAVAEMKAADLDRERLAIVHDLARATARLEAARRDAEAVSLPEIEARVAAARAMAAPGDGPWDRASAEPRHERAKDRLSAASAEVEWFAAAVPEAQKKADATGLPSGAAEELASADDEERRLSTELRDAETEAVKPSDGRPSAQELRDAEEAARVAELASAELRARADRMTVRRDELRLAAERAQGELEASERQTAGMDLAAVQHELATAREALAALAPAAGVSQAELQQSVAELESRNDALTSCEGRLNELRGKLELVAGRVGLERLEEERESVQRAREFAEEQELDYEASKHLLELLEATEGRRASHLGRCLGSPVTERFLALTGDLYAHVQLDHDLRMEGLTAAGETRRVEDLSVGTREQLATIIRLAIAAQLKTAVLLDDQLVHSDSGRLEWFRKQVRHSVHTHDHQVIVMTCRLSDYVDVDERCCDDGEQPTDGPSVRIVNVLKLLRRVRS